MVDTRKFSEFTNAGDIENADVTVGLKTGVNVRFTNPWTFLASGSTGSRPAIAADMYYRLRLNTDTELYEYYNPTSASWISIQEIPSPSASAMLISDNASALSWLGPLTDGQVVVGETSSAPTARTFTAGTNMSIDLTTPGQVIFNATASGSGTVNSGNANELAYYASTGTAVSGLTSANNGVLVTSNTGVPSILAGPGANGRVLQSNASAAPSYSTAAYPTTATSAGTLMRADGTDWLASTATFADTYGASELLYSNGANTVEGLATANSAQLVTNASGVPAMTASLTDGQVVIGSTGGTPAPATLTAGTGVSITNGAGSITINATGSGGYAWFEVTGTSQSMSVNSAYVANNASLVTLTLPSTAAIGNSVVVQGKGAGGWRIAQNAGQTINFGSSPTTTGTGGYLESTNQFDSIKLVCITANTDWAVLTGPQGTITVA